jgi:Tol biopolymer transport system component
VTIDGQDQQFGKIGAGQTRDLLVAGRGGVPAGGVAGSVALNVTSVGATASTFLTVYPKGAQLPTASNLNVQPNIISPNMVIVPIGADGKVSLFNAFGATHLLVDVLAWFPNNAAAASTERVSWANDPEPGFSEVFEDSIRPTISADGRFVAFEADTALTEGDFNGKRDIFVRDRVIGFTIVVSLSVDSEYVDGDSYDAEISGNGRYVVFTSDATNLVPDDDNGLADVFRYDMLEQTVVRVSVGPGTEQGESASTEGSISHDGRFVVFTTESANFDQFDTNGVADVYLRDVENETTVRLSTPDAMSSSNGPSTGASISDDGTTVVFESAASDLVAGVDGNGAADVYVWTGEALELVSTTALGFAGNGSSYGARINGDGSRVVFTTMATDLAPDGNPSEDVMLRDRETDTTTKVSVTTDDQDANGPSFEASLSADGRYISFLSLATNLVPNDTNDDRDVFVVDTATDDLIRASVSSDGAQAEPASPWMVFAADLSADGRYVAFDSSAPNLVDDDTNDKVDIFVRDQGTTPLAA